MDLLGGRKRATHAITRLLFHEMCCTLNGRRRPGLENQHTVQVLISAVFLTVLPAIKWPAVGGEVVPVLLYLALLSTFLGRLVPQLLVPSLVDPLFSLDFEHGLRFGFLLRVGARNCNHVVKISNHLIGSTRGGTTTGRVTGEGGLRNDER